MTARIHRWLIATSGLALIACEAPNEAPPEPARTEVVVAIRNAPTTYYIDRDGNPAGLEYDLALAFAEEHGWNLRLVEYDEVGEILEAVDDGDVDFAAAGLTKTAERLDRFLVGPTYQLVEERIVCAPGAQIERLQDLERARIRVIDDSSYVESLKALREELPGLRWRTTRALSTEQLLARVARGELQCTVADSTIYALDKRVLPQLHSPFAVGGQAELGWFVARESSELLALMDDWFETMSESQRLEGLQTRYYSAESPFSAYDLRLFREHVDNRLPAYEPLFRLAAEETGLEWTLLAAVGYQESHWQPDAVSHTGVVGLMMLTQAAASDMGVGDRADPVESIAAGARYLRRLLGAIPVFIRGEERLKLALAAYNVGLGHLEDARILAVELGHNPNTWPGVSSVLPLLSQERYYRRLRNGYARGSEPVLYVDRIGTYRQVLEQMVAQRPDDERVQVEQVEDPAEAGSGDDSEESDERVGLVERALESVGGT